MREAPVVVTTDEVYERTRDDLCLSLRTAKGFFLSFLPRYSVKDLVLAKVAG